MISIVLPVYNGEKYLCEAIESILKQTYTDFELIIVNDASTDSTPQIIEKYIEIDNRIKVINNLINKKLPSSLNVGFEKSSGDYFTWTSDDNVLMPCTLEKLVNALITEPNVDLVFSRCEIIDSNGKHLGESSPCNDLNEIFYNNIIRASFLYKRKVHEALNGYDVSKFLVEDYDFFLRAYRQFTFKYIPEILYKYRFHGANLGVKRMEDVSLRKIELLKDNLNYVKDKKIIDCINREISKSYYDASNAYYNMLEEDVESKLQTKVIWNYRAKDMLKKLLGR